MANKIVILQKGQTTGVEYPLDTHTGTDLRDLCYEGGDQFWITRDPATVHHYRLDPANATARKLASDDITLSGGTTTDLWGITTDGQKLFYSSHNFRAGTHNNFITNAGKGGVPVQTLTQDGGAGDGGQRIKGLDFLGDRLIYLYQGVAVNTVARILRLHAGSPATINQLSLGAAGVTGICFEYQGQGFWIVDSSNVLKLMDISGNVVEQFTIGNSGTARGLCNMRDGRLAVAMT